MQAGFRILVVDDNVDAAESLAMLLSLDAHATQVAHSGANALQVAACFRPNIVFLDLGMPNMNGYEVARELRRLPELHDTVLVALSGWGAAADQQRCREAGFNEHLTKPADFDAIERLLAKITRSRAAVC